MKDLLPSPSANTHFFAYELPPIADYVQAMAAVWYNRRFSAPGGHVSRLRQLGKATDQYYLFHFHDDTLVNLMPELQEQPGTLFLWNQPPLIERLDAGDQSHPLAPGSFSADRVAGPPQALRLATLVQAPEAGQGWASLAYTVTVPPGSTLRFAALKDAGGLAEEDGMAFRVRIQKPSGELEQVFATFLQPDLPGMASGWREVSVPLEAYWDQTILVRLEVSAGANSSHDLGYWSNPRLVRDTPY